MDLMIVFASFRSIFHGSQKSIEANNDLKSSNQNKMSDKNHNQRTCKEDASFVKNRIAFDREYST